MDPELMRIGVSLSGRLLGRFDTIVEKRGYSSRSEGIREAIKTYIQNYEWMSEVTGERLGIITIIYESGRKGLADRLSAARKEHIGQILSSIQVNLDRDSIMDMVVMRGDAREVVAFAEKVMACKGVKYLKLTTAVPGADAEGGIEGRRDGARPSRITFECRHPQAHSSGPEMPTKAHPGRGAARRSR